jgi:hypothetical protein
MIYKFRIISSENEDFIREVAINSHSTFYDLHIFLVDELNYDSSQMNSFFLTDQNWHKETEVTLIDMTDGLDPEIKVMDKINLGQLISEKKQRLLYVFDQFAERSLFLELFEIRDGELPHPKCIRKEGTPPVQLDSSVMESGDLQDMDLNEFASDEDVEEFSENHEDISSYDEEDWY